MLAQKFRHHVAKMLGSWYGYFGPWPKDLSVAVLELSCSGTSPSRQLGCNNPLITATWIQWWCVSLPADCWNYFVYYYRPPFWSFFPFPGESSGEGPGGWCLLVPRLSSCLSSSSWCVSGLLLWAACFVAWYSTRACVSSAPSWVTAFVLKSLGD